MDLWWWWQWGSKDCCVARKRQPYLVTTQYGSFCITITGTGFCWVGNLVPVPVPAAKPVWNPRVYPYPWHSLPLVELVSFPSVYGISRRFVRRFLKIVRERTITSGAFRIESPGSVTSVTRMPIPVSRHSWGQYRRARPSSSACDVISLKNCMIYTNWDSIIDVWAVNEQWGILFCL